VKKRLQGYPPRFYPLRTRGLATLLWLALSVSFAGATGAALAADAPTATTNHIVTPVAPPPDAAPAAALPGTEAGPLLPCPEHSAAGGPSAYAPVIAPVAAAIRERVHKRVGGVVASVCRMPFGLYEVAVDGEIIYVDERVNFLIAGNAFDMRTQENLTSARREELLRVDFKALPFDLAVKTVRGNGTRVLAVFEDPNCPYCKRFEKDIATLTNTTIYTFLYPILSRDQANADDSYPKSKAIWCAPDRSVAWSDLMLQGKHLVPAADSCEHPLDKILALGQKMHITGTPTLIFTDGRRAPGAVPLDRVEKMMADAAAAAPAK